MTALHHTSFPEQTIPELWSVPGNDQEVPSPTVVQTFDGRIVDIEELHCGESVRGTLECQEHTQVVQITEARRIRDEAGSHTVVMLPGLLEQTGIGTGRRLHNALSVAFPYSRILSIATDGVDRDDTPLPWRDAIGLSFDAMARERLQIVQSITRGNPVTLVGESMGSVIGLKVALHNIRAGGPVQIDHIINHSHAQVAPGRVLRDMAARFPPHVVMDIVRESRRHPLDVLANIGGIALAAEHGPAVVGNIINLMRGTLSAEVLEVCSEVPTTFISGTLDPLAQRQHLERLQRVLPHMVSLIFLEKKGHACSVNYDKTAELIASVDWPHSQAS